MRPLPVDPQRLRREFPTLTDEDLASYEAVTRRILGRPSPAERSRVTREVLERGRRARERAAAGDELGEDDALAFRYLSAVEKMQRPVAPRRP